AVGDEDRKPCVVVDREVSIVGFFVLHKHYRHEGYDTRREVVYVRSLSINESVQGKGYGTKVALNMPIFVQNHFSDYDHLHLVVMLIIQRHGTFMKGPVLFIQRPRKTGRSDWRGCITWTLIRNTLVISN